MKAVLWSMFFVWFVVAFTGCETHVPSSVTFTSTTTSVSTATTTVIANPSCLSGQWCYDSIVMPRITPAMLNADFSLICSNASVDRIQVWLGMEQGITWAESNWIPNSSYTETTIDPKTGLNMLSVGMFALSYEDAPNYPNTDCSTITAANLIDPIVNIKCGLAIQNKLLTLYTGDVSSVLGKYWSTQRTVFNGIPNARYQVFLNQFYSIVPGCMPTSSKIKSRIHITAKIK